MPGPCTSTASIDATGMALSRTFWAVSTARLRMLCASWNGPLLSAVGLGSHVKILAYSIAARTDSGPLGARPHASFWTVTASSKYWHCRSNWPDFPASSDSTKYSRPSSSMTAATAFCKWVLLNAAFSSMCRSRPMMSSRCSRAATWPSLRAIWTLAKRRADCFHNVMYFDPFWAWRMVSTAWSKFPRWKSHSAMPSMMEAVVEWSPICSAWPRAASRTSFAKA